MTPGARHLVRTNALPFNSESGQMGGSFKVAPSLNYKCVGGTCSLHLKKAVYKYGHIPASLPEWEACPVGGRHVSLGTTALANIPTMLLLSN